MAKSRGEAIVPGVHVLITGDPLRTLYKTVEVSFQHQSVVVIDAGDNEFVLPWDLIEPEQRGMREDRPYWFTGDARKQGESLEIGDDVKVDVTPDEKYELTDIFWEYGDVEVRKVGLSKIKECLGVMFDRGRKTDDRDTLGYSSYRRLAVPRNSRLFTINAGIEC